MKLRVISIDADGTIRLAADGPLDAAALAQSENPLATALGQNWASHRILIDLGAVDRVDSTAIGWLINARGALADHGGLLVLHSMHPHVRQILQTLRLETIIPLAVDEQSARDAATRHPRLVMAA